MPQCCNGCGGDFSVEHASRCRFGGLVIRRHKNEVQDAIGDLASLVWGNVIREPVIYEQSATSGGALVADFCVLGCGFLRLRYYLTFV